jgi:hypothetical protein
MSQDDDATVIGHFKINQTWKIVGLEGEPSGRHGTRVKVEEKFLNAARLNVFSLVPVGDKLRRLFPAQLTNRAYTN